MPTLSWIIERLLCKPVEGTLTDVVITADWRCNGIDTVGIGDTAKTYIGTCYGSCSFAPPSGTFIPYKDLTQQQVLDWCFSNGVNKSAIEANVNQQIANQINPPVVTPPLPWTAEQVVVPPMLPYIAPPLVANDAPVADAPAA